MSKKYDLVLNWPGSILRLALLSGSAEACFELGLPRPDDIDEIIASSAGAMAASAVISSRDKAVKITGNLSPDQIFSYMRGLKIKLAALGITSIGLVGFLVLLDHKSSKTQKILTGLGGLATLFAADVIVGKEIIYGKPPLSSAPLRALLMDEDKGLDFEAIFNSKIRLGVIVTDMNKPGEVIFYNHDPLNSDPNNQSHRERWVNILLASARLPGKYQFIGIDGIDTVDGEVWTDFPIRQMKQYKKIIRFDYWPPLQPGTTPSGRIHDVMRSFDIMRDRCTQKKMEKYELERKADPALPEIYYLRLSPELMEAVPHIQLHNFTPNNMKMLQNIGYETVFEQKDDLRRYLEA